MLDAWYDTIPSKVGTIVGKTPVSITQDDDEIIFVFTDGTACKFFHEQDCCEGVVIDDVNGDWDDLIGVPLLVSDERVGEQTETGESYGSETWTFYTFRSIKGSVDVKWHGSSNGYYSESVDFIVGKVTE